MSTEPQTLEEQLAYAAAVMTALEAGTATPEQQRHAATVLLYLGRIVATYSFGDETPTGLPN